VKHDKNRALEVIEFVQMLNLTGDFYGKPFTLLDWQYKALWEVYGTVNEKGYRQYRYAYLEVPKKNGKTETIAKLALYHLACDPNDGQIYCCAAEKGQAQLVYDAAIATIDQCTDLQNMFKITDSKKEIVNKFTKTRLKVLSAEAYSKHGLNPTVVIFDELHAQPNRNLWDVMTFGAGASRNEPLWWVITTAGDDPDRKTIGYEIHEYAQDIISGEKIDPSWWAKIYGAPEDADIFDEQTWYDANPSLGTAIDIDVVRREAQTARNSETAERLFRWLRLNQWISTKKIGWLPLTLWDATVKDWNPAELIGKKCYAGLDLSSVTDLTALALLFPPQPGIPDWRVVFEAWIPEDKMKERIERDGVPFDRWIKQKFMHATPGDVVDYDFVEARIIQVATQYDLKILATDPWNSHMLMQRLQKSEAMEGTDILDVAQTMSGMSPSMKEIERLFRAGQMSHDINPVARWCFGNVVVAMDGNENTKPMKNKSKDRIDLIVALINAMATAMKKEKISIYETRGMRSLS
jgi:phage terminase large subunit-like protein